MEAVEILLEYEEQHHKPGTPYVSPAQSFQATRCNVTIKMKANKELLDLTFDTDLVTELGGCGPRAVYLHR